MSLDTAPSKPTALSEARSPGGAKPAGPNGAVIDLIRTHHAQLADELQGLTDSVLSAARSGDSTAAAKDLHDWYRTVLIPHAIAEEHALYSPAADLDSTRLLVSGMLAEHRFLISRVADLALAARSLDVATAAAAAQAVFTVHLNKENELLLPALDEAGLDLAAILDGMHEILGQAGVGHGEDDGCGCGCGCGHDDSDGEHGAVSVQIGNRPAGTDGGLAATTDGDLDVRVLPHGQRHEIIFGRLDALEPGQALVIVNDHDPKPLRYQTSAMWPDRFEWSYLESGPQRWRIAITRAH